MAAREASDLVSLRFSLREAWLRARRAAKRAARSFGGGGGAAAVSDVCAAGVVAVEESVGGAVSDALGAVVVVAEVWGATSSSANRRLEGSVPSVRPGEPFRFKAVGIVQEVLGVWLRLRWEMDCDNWTSAVTKVQMGLSMRTKFRTYLGLLHSGALQLSLVAS